jgi:hypothetical protein
MGPLGGPTMQLGISSGILEPALDPTLEPWGTTGVVPVGPLLAVLMSLQQGRLGDRSTLAFRYVGLFAGFGPVSELFLRRLQRPNTAPLPQAGPSMGKIPHGCAALRRREREAALRSGALDQGPCRFLNAGSGTDAPPPRADTIFQTSAFSGPKLAFGPCRPDPPSYMRLTVAISRVFDRWGFG